jgi:RNA polymerase-binding transcription factor DksA
VDAGADPGTNGGEVEVAGETVTAAVAEPAPREPTVLDRIQDELDDVERALERLDDGSYGTCQACGTTIEDDLLATRPTTRFCPEHEPAPAT